MVIAVIVRTCFVESINLSINQPIHALAESDGSPTPMLAHRQLRQPAFFTEKKPRWNQAPPVNATPTEPNPTLAYHSYIPAARTQAL